MVFIGGGSSLTSFNYELEDFMEITIVGDWSENENIYNDLASQLSDYFPFVPAGGEDYYLEMQFSMVHMSNGAPASVGQFSFVASGEGLGESEFNEFQSAPAVGATIRVYLTGAVEYED